MKQRMLICAYRVGLPFNELLLFGMVGPWSYMRVLVRQTPGLKLMQTSTVGSRLPNITFDKVQYIIVIRCAL